MNFAQTTYQAATWGIASGWVVVMVVMMVLCMGGMMFGMSRMGRGSTRGSWAPWDRFMTKESPLELLERRFAEGEISAEDYRARREVLLNGTARPNGKHKDESVTATPAGEGRR
jgi:uncharacterized membrane protein